MPTYAIGDIQGCCDEFETLLDRIRFDPARDRVWLTGDLVNRGPRSLDVLRLVRSFGDAAITVLGNHDLHLVAAAADASRLKSGDTLDEILRAPDREELLRWLKARPLLHHDATLGYTMIHAGLPPEWDLEIAQRCATELHEVLKDDDRCLHLLKNMYGNQPDRWSETLAGIDRLRFITNCFTRLRMCRADGTLEVKYKGPPDKAPSNIMPWFRVPGRKSRSLRIVFGHWSALGYYDAESVLSIDTGCVWGSSLCAVRLDSPAPPILVPCSSSGRSIGEE